MVARTGGLAKIVGDESVEAGRGPGQLGWYAFAAGLVRGKTVLDAGCGLGHGVDLLAQHAKDARGQDLDPRLAAERPVIIAPLDDIPDKSFDIVTSIDVVEHVEDDRAFVCQLTRIAREAVFLTTPNWTISRCAWPYHLREYTPRELMQLLAPFGHVQLFKGDSFGKNVHEVRWQQAYYLLNDLRTWRLTTFAARCTNRFLPPLIRLYGHNAALLQLP